MPTANDLEALFEEPLDSFTATRDALAARARGAGDQEEARRIRALKKPTVAAWAVNQLARRHRDELTALFDVVEALENAGDAAELRSLTDKRRQLLSTLTGRARGLLEESGHAPAPATVDAITQTLYASSEEERARVLEGRLSAPLTPSGIPDAFLATSLGDLDESVDQQASRRAEELGRSAEEAEREMRALQERAEELREQTRRAEAAAEEARRRAEKARSAADDAISKLSD